MQEYRKNEFGALIFAPTEEDKKEENQVLTQYQETIEKQGEEIKAMKKQLEALLDIVQGGTLDNASIEPPMEGGEMVE